MSLQDFLQKCKSDRVFIPLVIIFVGMGAFGLGRLSKIEEERQGVSIEAPARVVEALKGQNWALNGGLGALNATPDQSVSQSNTTNTVSTDGQVVASKNGTKYHFPWCSGAKTISEANKIYFNSTVEARAAEYTPAGNCKGLK